ncbi:mechanosensitive ion channel family protein [Halomarina ordinaria]|uniref:Phosphatase n=1 Tax=Halomarina ordinaria TaxID=3033939 RepID=A0ABD5UIF0_9EURY|nr:phosphatase [Halomarina sp. PSRA2]
MTETNGLLVEAPLQAVPESIQPLVDGLLVSIPLILGALVILFVGWIFGRILGGAVKRVVRRVRPSQYATGTPFEPDSDPDDSLAQSLGDLTRYVVYFLTLIAVLSYLGIAIPGAFLTSLGAGVVQLVVALAILVAGVAIGRTVGRLVTNVVNGLGLDRYARRAPVDDAAGRASSIGSAAGKLAEYLIYFLALLIALDYAGIALPGVFLTGIAGGVVQIIVAAAILVVGIAIGRAVGDLVTGVVAGLGLDRYVSDTPIANATASVGGVAAAVGKTVEYLIYFFAFVAAVDTLGFPALSDPLSDFVGQIPLLIGGVIVLLVGLYVADLLGDIVAGFDRTRATDLVGLGVQVFVSYVVIVFALDTAGFDTTVLTNLFNAVIVAFFGALGLGLALAIGVGIGWGSKDYVAKNIDDWMSRARSSASDLRESGSQRTGTGTENRESYGDDSPGTDD